MEKQQEREEQQREEEQSREEGQSREEEQLWEKEQSGENRRKSQREGEKQRAELERERDGRREEGREQPRPRARGRKPETKASKTIKLLNTIAQSIQNKMKELEAVVDDLDPDFILLTETWCNNTTPDASLNIKRYSLELDLRQDCIDTAQDRWKAACLQSTRNQSFITRQCE
jgi:hypothetical protein